MTREEFEFWWFELNGEEKSFEKYGNKISKADIRRQPSFPSDNAITEAVWELAYNDMVK